MVKYRCEICQREFSTRGSLKQHANTKHQGRMTLPQRHEPVRQKSSQPSREVMRPEHDTELWSTSITMTAPSTSQKKPVIPSTPQKKPIIPSTPQDKDIDMEELVFNEVQTQELEELEDVSVNLARESRYNLRKKTRVIELENLEESAEENFEDPPTNLADFEFDSEDLQGATMDDALDAIEGKDRPECIAKWPNDAYRDFMELIVEGNISNKIGDKIINFFNRHSNLENSPLPSSTKNGKDYLNQINSPSLDFKEKVVATYLDTDFKLYYRPIFRAIQTLLQRPKVADNFVHKGILKRDVNGRIFGEPYEGDWWLKTEKTIPPLNHLLSVILYSDATTFDGLGKTSGHPVFLTLGNLPNWVRNLPEAKVLLGFLPKVQDTGIKTSENF